ncbi:MAG: hypothetical protein IJA62_03175 [Ruminococcus sp.]|nr:hypothetical protein [Ruminococcus sp.]
MKNTLRLIALTLCLVFVASFMVACDKGSKGNTDGTDAPQTTAAAEPTIDEAKAKQLAFTDLNIQESAAEDLTVEFENNNYTITFKWSGFEYKYVIDAVLGDIAQIYFDGEPLL